jgi:hypothetical protein
MAAQMKAIPVNWNKVFSRGVAGVVSNTRALVFTARATTKRCKM